MKPVATESTTLISIAYDASRELLQLKFRDGTVYQYFHVPPAIHEALLQAPSQGRYFNRVIRDRFEFAAVSVPFLS